MVSSEGSAGALDQVEDPPVEPADVEMDKAPIAARLAHGEGGILGELVAQQHGPAALPPIPVNPGVVVIRPEHQGVEAVYRGFLEEIVLQPRPAVIALEQEAEGMLRDLGIAAGATENPDTTIDLEAFLSIGPDQLNRAAPLPAHALPPGVRVQSPRTENIVNLCDNRQGRQRTQTFPDTLGIGRVACNLRIHLVVCPRSPTPVRWKSSRIGGLAQDVVREDIAVRGNLRGQVAILVGSRSKRDHCPGGAPCNLNGPGIELSPGRVRNLPIQRVVNPRALRGAQKLQLERLRVEATLMAQDGVLYKGNPHLGIGIHPVGTGHKEITKTATGPSSIGMVGTLGRIRFVLVNNRARCLRIKYSEKLPPGAEAEVRMQFSGWVPAVLPGGEHKQVSARSDRHIGKDPLPGLAGLIAQRPAGKADRDFPLVVELDPV